MSPVPTLVLSSMCAMTLTVFAGCAPSGGPTGADLDQFQGSWLPDAAEWGGNHPPSRYARPSL